MEETLGKRIMRHRKSLGLTQDQLAEQLGVTAQAVSKWENDQSCPDITMLPKLSHIFGITTDQLLGSAPEESAPVFAGEVVEDSELDQEKTGWEFHWDASRKGHLTFAALVLAVGVQLFLAKYLAADISFWQILWPSSLILFGISGFFGSFSFIRVTSMLLGGWFLADYWDVLPFRRSSDLVFPGLVIIFGLSLLVAALKKPRNSKVHIHRQHKKKVSDYNCDGENFSYDASFGESRQQVKLTRLRSGKISCNFGDYVIDFSAVEEVTPDCSLEVNCSFGEVTLLVPGRFAVSQRNSTAIASFDVSGHPDPEPSGTIDLTANISFGEVILRYI